MLIAKGINKSFGNVNVLKDVKISVGMSKTVVIIGRSGSGKSTLLRCLGLLEYPDTGTVFLDREAIYTGDRSPNLLTREFKLAQYRTDLAMVFQRFNLFPHLNVLDNVTIGPREVLALAPDDAEARAREELSHVGLAEYEERFPSELSGGQQQRVAIARALSMRPKVILFDEPTSALDPELVGDVLKVIQTLAEQGRTMVVVTHELEFARKVADEVLFMHEGEIVEKGTPEEIFTNPTNRHAQRFLAAIT